jgi:recombination protein RecA
MYGEGISREGDLLDLAVAQRVLEKSGAWFSYKGDRLGQGRENAKLALKEHPETLRKIEREVKLKLGMPVRDEQEPAAKAAAAEKK